MTEEITLRFGFDRRVFPRALSAWWFSAVPPVPFFRRVINWAVGWSVLLVATIVLGSIGVEPVLVGAALIGAVLLVLGFVVLQRVRMRRFVDVVGDHWRKAGETLAVFGPAGLRLTTDVSRVELDWAAIEAIARARGATVLRSGMTMIAIPDAALPAGLSPQAFRDRLAAWRAA